MQMGHVESSIKTLSSVCVNDDEDDDKDVGGWLGINEIDERMGFVEEFWDTKITLDKYII